MRKIIERKRDIAGTTYIKIRDEYSLESRTVNNLNVIKLWELGGHRSSRDVLVVRLQEVEHDFRQTLACRS